MVAIFIITALVLFIACLHQANEMTARTHWRFKAGLILMMVGDVAAALGALYSQAPAILCGLSLICISASVWLWENVERIAP